MPIFVHYEVFTVATRTQGSVLLLNFLCGSKSRDKSLVVLAKSEGGAGGGGGRGGGEEWRRKLLYSIQIHWYSCHNLKQFIPRLSLRVTRISLRNT